MCKFFLNFFLESFAKWKKMQEDVNTTSQLKKDEPRTTTPTHSSITLASATTIAQRTMQSKSASIERQEASRWLAILQNGNNGDHYDLHGNFAESFLWTDARQGSVLEQILLGSALGYPKERGRPHPQPPFDAAWTVAEGCSFILRDTPHPQLPLRQRQLHHGNQIRGRCFPLLGRLCWWYEQILHQVDNSEGLATACKYWAFENNWKKSVNKFFYSKFTLLLCFIIKNQSRCKYTSQTQKCSTPSE